MAALEFVIEATRVLFVARPSFSCSPLASCARFALGFVFMGGMATLWSSVSSSSPYFESQSHREPTKPFNLSIESTGPTEERSSTKSSLRIPVPVKRVLLKSRRASPTRQLCSLFITSTLGIPRLTLASRLSAVGGPGRVTSKSSGAQLSQHGTVGSVQQLNSAVA